MGKLDGKVAIVTGASRGIGQAISELFAEEGAKVVCAARTFNEGDHRMLEGSLTRTIELIRAKGGEAKAVIADVSTEEDCIALVQSARDYGPVDILVNNAALSYFQPITEMQTNRWFRAFAVDVHGPFMLAKEVLKDMIPRRSGAIINISSGAAIGPGRGPYADKTNRGGTMYGAVKAALERFTQGLAQEVAQYRWDHGRCGVTVARRADTWHRLPQARFRHGRSARRAAGHDGARGAAAGERAGGQGERPRHLQPADTEGVRLDRKGGRSRRGQPWIGLFADLIVLRRFRRLWPTLGHKRQHLLDQQP